MIFKWTSKNLVFKILNESKNNFIINVSNKIRLKNWKDFYLPVQQK